MEAEQGSAETVPVAQKRFQGPFLLLLAEPSATDFGLTLRAAPNPKDGTGKVTQPPLAASGKHRQECLCHFGRPPALLPPLKFEGALLHRQNIIKA
jgi:hypothetical protein